MIVSEPSPLTNLSTDISKCVKTEAYHCSRRSEAVCIPVYHEASPLVPSIITQSTHVLIPYTRYQHKVGHSSFLEIISSKCTSWLKLKGECIQFAFFLIKISFLCAKQLLYENKSKCKM